MASASSKFHMSPELISLLRKQPPQDVKPHFQCMICQSLLCNPFQTRCGCFACDDCIHDAVAANDQGVIPCPAKLEDCGEVSSDSVRADIAKRRDVMNLVIACPLSTECDQSFKVSDYLEHQKVCDFVSITCPKCDAMCLRGKLEEHLQQQCSESLTKCPNCQLEMTRHELQMDHTDPRLGKCCVHYRTEKCPFCHEQGDFTLESLRAHSKQCTAWRTSCPFRDLGCTDDMLESQLEQHMLEQICKHIDLVARVMTLSEEMLQECCQKLSHVQQGMEERNQTFKDLHLKMVEAVDNLAASPMSKQLSNLDSQQHSQEKIEEDLKEMRRVAFCKGDFTWQVTVTDFNQSESIGSEFYSPALPGYLLQLRSRVERGFFYVSVRFCAGKYDPVMKWPFPHKIALTLRGGTGTPWNRLYLASQCSTEGKRRPNANMQSPWNEFQIMDVDTLRMSYMRNSVVYVSCQIKME